MLRNIFLVSLLIYAVCAAHWDISEVDSAEDQDEEISADGMPTQQSFFTCMICKKFMKIVKKKLSNKATVDEIETKLKKVCHMMTAYLKKDDCNKLFEESMKMLIKELKTKDGLNTFCTRIHYCKSEP